jgi:3-dehydroquinate dehydratase/shikimate dehydrogenase
MNTAFRRETVNAVYLALQTKDVNDLFKLAREVPIEGLSVTMPLKQSVMPQLERTDALSAKIGAVNTIRRLPNGKFYGFNTDVQGIVAPLERRLSLRDAKVLVLGAGGAGRAAVFACRDRGAEVWVYNRTPETAQKLARQAGAKSIKREAIAKTSFDVIIHATPAGMAGNKTAALLGPEDLNARYVFDLVYNPLETPLLRMARQKGIAVISGVEMFVQQGARQFEIWTGKPAPEEEMLRVVLHSLRQNAESKDGAAAANGTPVTHADPEPSVTPSPKPAAAGAGKPSDNQVKTPNKQAKTSDRPAAVAAKPHTTMAKTAAKAPAKATNGATKAAATKSSPVKTVKKSVVAKSKAKAKFSSNSHSKARR